MMESSHPRQRDDEEAQSLIPFEQAPNSIEPTHETDDSSRLGTHPERFFFVASVILALILWGPTGGLILALFLALHFCIPYMHKCYNVNQPTRVKSVDCHPSQPWVLLCFFSGHVMLVKESSSSSSSESDDDNDKPTCLRLMVSPGIAVRSGRFVPQKDCFVTASDDSRIRVYSLSGKKLHDFEGHSDFIRSLAVHPTLPCFLSCSDDQTVKLWDLEYNAACTGYWKGHEHYIMDVKIHPSKTDEFVTASLDRSIVAWRLDDSSQPLFRLEGHEQGVNCLAFCEQNNNGLLTTLLASGSDDQTIRLWNYETRQILHVLVGHTHNVNGLLFHPTASALLVSVSEDCTVRLWKTMVTTKNCGEDGNSDIQNQCDPSSSTRMIQSLNCESKGRGWALASGTSQEILAGFDEGCFYIKSLEERNGAIQLALCEQPSGVFT